MMGRILFCLLGLMFVPGSWAKVNHDNQTWPVLAVSKDGSSWIFNGDIQPRFIENSSYVSPMLYRGSIGRRLNKGFSAALGYAYLEFRQPSRFIEDRPFLQLAYSKRLVELKSVVRFRLEERYFRGEDASVTRLRILGKINQPIFTNSFFGVLSNEYFWNANSYDPTPGSQAPKIKAGFDQNRFFIGFGLYLDEKRKHTTEIGYMNQYVNGINADSRNNILLLNFILNF